MILLLFGTNHDSLTICNDSKHILTIPQPLINKMRIGFLVHFQCKISLHKSGQRSPLWGNRCLYYLFNYLPFLIIIIEKVLFLVNYFLAYLPDMGNDLSFRVEHSQRLVLPKSQDRVLVKHKAPEFAQLVVLGVLFSVENLSARIQENSWTRRLARSPSVRFCPLTETSQKHIIDENSNSFRLGLRERSCLSHVDGIPETYALGLSGHMLLVYFFNYKLYY